MWLLDVLGSAGFGAVTGGLFGWLGKREERENMKMKFGHDLAMLNAKTDATIEIAKMGIEEAKNAGALLVEKIEAAAFEVSQKSTSKFSDTVKSMIRPVILGVLMYQTYSILGALEQLTGGLSAFKPEEVLGLYRIVVLSVTGLTATAVGWYFAARSSKQFDKLLEKWHP
ncbi:MAG: hypothetical protein JKX85_00885 [Phycisphaeraceae bacterium]|nr:hypothetical protein [Phycisphaeraceae bacterium]